MGRVLNAALADLTGTRRGGALGVVMLLGLAAGAIDAQDPPSPLGQPLLDASGNVREDAFIKIPLRPDDARYGVIQGNRLKEILLEVDAISLTDRDRGNPFWGRNVGTQGHEDTQEWVESHFRRHGLSDVHHQEFKLAPQWKISSWDIAFEAGGRTFELESARPPEDAVSTGAQGLEFELVWVAGGSDADYLGRDVRGKAVLVQDVPLPGTLRHTLALEGVVERAYQKGAAAVGIVYGISDNFAVWQRTGEGPGFNVGYADGMRLREILGRGETVTVKLHVESERASGLTAASVWGTLPGQSDEEILIIAHMDGYFQSALDNASGLAVMMGRMARDVPSIQLITSPEIKHTEQDTPEWIPAVGLEQIARAYARIIDGLNELDRREIEPAPAS